MSDDLTEVILLTSSSFARIDTIVIFTSFSVRTIFISLTFSLGARYFGISKGTRRTLASKARDALRGADSSRTTRVGITWVRGLNTFLVLTDVSCLTVWIPFTFWTTTSDGVRFGNQALETSTDGVSKFVGHTPSSRTTRTRITRIWFQDTSERLKTLKLSLEKGKIKTYFWFSQM